MVVQGRGEAKELTTLPVLRYGSGHRKRWFKNPIHTQGAGDHFQSRISACSPCEFIKAIMGQLHRQLNEGTFPSELRVDLMTIFNLEGYASFLESAPPDGAILLGRNEKG